MRAFRRLQSLPLMVLLFATFLRPASATEVTVCIIAAVQNNTVYFNNATSVTRLMCELSAKNYFPTLVELYSQGWELIQVVGGDHVMALGAGAPSPLYFLQRQTSSPGTKSKSPAEKR